MINNGLCNSTSNILVEVSDCSIIEPLDERVVVKPLFKPSDCTSSVIISMETPMI